MKKVAIFKGPELELDEVITTGDLLASEQWELIRDLFMYQPRYHEGRKWILFDDADKVLMLGECAAGFETLKDVIDNELINNDELLWKVLTAASEQMVRWSDIGGPYFFIRMNAVDVGNINWQYQRDEMEKVI